MSVALFVFQCTACQLWYVSFGVPGGSLKAKAAPGHLVVVWWWGLHVISGLVNLRHLRPCSCIIKEWIRVEFRIMLACSVQFRINVPHETSPAIRFRFGKFIRLLSIKLGILFCEINELRSTFRKHRGLESWVYLQPGKQKRASLLGQGPGSQHLKPQESLPGSPKLHVQATHHHRK